jgi:hypothetical protein
MPNVKTSDRPSNTAEPTPVRTMWGESINRSAVPCALAAIAWSGGRLTRHLAPQLPLYEGAGDWEWLFDGPPYDWRDPGEYPRVATAMRYLIDWVLEQLPQMCSSIEGQSYAASNHGLPTPVEARLSDVALMYDHLVGTFPSTLGQLIDWARAMTDREQAVAIAGDIELSVFQDFGTSWMLQGLIPPEMLDHLSDATFAGLVEALAH